MTTRHTLVHATTTRPLALAPAGARRWPQCAGLPQPLSGASRRVSPRSCSASFQRSSSCSLIVSEEGRLAHALRIRGRGTCTCDGLQEQGAHQQNVLRWGPALLEQSTLNEGCAQRLAIRTIFGAFSNSNTQTRHGGPGIQHGPHAAGAPAKDRRRARCVLAGAWATGAMTTLGWAWRGGNTAVGRAARVM
jgi:hypothetical protein